MEAHVLAIILLGLSCFIAGSIPLKIARRQKQPFVISLLLCLGGGVVLATSIMHMLAEVRDRLPELSEILFSSGFLLLYAIDEVIHACISNAQPVQHSGSSNHSRSRTDSISSSSSSEEIVSPMYRRTSRTSYGTLDKLPKRARIDSVSQSFESDVLLEPHPSFDYTSFDNELHQYPEKCCRKHEKEKSFHRAGWKSQLKHKIEREDLEAAESKRSSLSTDGSSELCHIELKEKPCPKSSMSLPGLLTALLVHAILEGCSIGVQTNSSQVLFVVAAVASHKLVLAFCLGLELAAAGYQGFRYVLVISVFSIGCPLGIIIGLSLTQSSESLMFLEAPLQAVAAGSLLYVAVFEVLPRERFKWQHNSEMRCAGLFQMLFVLIGFTFITVIDHYTDSHGH